MENIRIGSYQGHLEDNNFEANIIKAEKVINESRKMKLDFLCFPECYLTGYTKQAVVECAISLDDSRLLKFIKSTSDIDTVIIIGLNEKSDTGVYNTCLVIYKGMLIGKARKTMLTQGYDSELFKSDFDIPVFEHKDIKFGIAICHTTSFVEPAQYMRLKGARLLFTPHFNNISPEIRGNNGDLIGSFWEHRTMVLNNQAALATLLKMVVVRSNVIIINKNELGSGDSNIWDMNGKLVAEGTPFVEQIVVAEFEKKIFMEEHFINRKELPITLYENIHSAAKEFLD